MKEIIFWLVVGVIVAGPSWYFAARKEYNRGYADGLAEGKKGECIAWETTEGFWSDSTKCIDRAPLGYRSAFDEEISILAEKKRCDEWGGNLGGRFSSVRGNEPMKLYCIKDVFHTEEDGTRLSGIKKLFEYSF